MKRSLIGSVLKHALMILLSLVILMPFYMVLVNSFKTKGEAARMSLGLPSVWQFSNYAVVVEQGKLVQGFFNSALYASVSTFVAVISCAMAAFVLSRKRTRLNSSLFYFFLIGLFFPLNYVTLAKIMQITQIANTRLGLIVAFTSSMIPFCIFVIRNFISTVPVQLDEAATIDGASPLKLFFQIILPLLKPILVTAFILQLMGVWNDFMTPLYLSGKSSMWPMNLAIYNFFGKEKSSWNLVFADIILNVIPVLAIYLFGQRYIIGGLTSGAVKE
ncbi:MAG: carbohydrate ABC transporter permease [Eubacteriales bacterium]|nr:carbohydrate ABC transporter permease [Eubacteriales bacterium]